MDNIETIMGLRREMQWAVLYFQNIIGLCKKTLTRKKLTWARRGPKEFYLILQSFKEAIQININWLINEQIQINVLKITFCNIRDDPKVHI